VPLVLMLGPIWISGVSCQWRWSDLSQGERFRTSTLIGNLNLSQSPNGLLLFITARSLYEGPVGCLSV